MSKKGAKAQPKDQQSYEIRDVVLAKVRGYPPWPGIIADPDNVPKNVSKERPNGKNKKGNWYCVRFFPAGDYAWVVPKDISKLQQHEIEAYIQEPFKKSGELLQGYKIALNPKKWEEEREAAQAKVAEEEENAEVDELDDSVAEAADGVDEEEEKKPKNKKRKRDSEVASVKSKPKSKAKKEPAEPKKKAASAAKSKKNGIKSKALVESEDEGADGEGEGEDAGPSSDKKSSPPPAKKQKRDKDEEELESALANDSEAIKVRDWRHKLQKAFLSKAVPKEDDMPGYDALFTTVETYEGMSIQYLTFSKIGKVMRHIHALSPEKVPRDDEFKFRDRAKVLVDRWHEILSASKASEGPIRKPATNGKPHAEDAGASANGKDEANGKGEKKDEPTGSDKDKMEVDTKDEPASTGDADAVADAEQDAPAEEAPDAPPAAEESAADVTMEAA